MKDITDCQILVLSHMTMTTESSAVKLTKSKSPVNFRTLNFIIIKWFPQSSSADAMFADKQSQKRQLRQKELNDEVIQTAIQELKDCVQKYV